MDAQSRTMDDICTKEEIMTKEEVAFIKACLTLAVVAGQLSKDAWEAIEPVFVHEAAQRDIIYQVLGEWTTKRPTQYGWYWFRHTHDSKAKIVELVDTGFEDAPIGIAHHSCSPGPLHEHGEWSGPILFPTKGNV